MLINCNDYLIISSLPFLFRKHFPDVMCAKLDAYKTDFDKH